MTLLYERDQPYKLLTWTPITILDGEEVVQGADSEDGLDIDNDGAMPIQIPKQQVTRRFDENFGRSGVSDVDRKLKRLEVAMKKLGHKMGVSLSKPPKILYTENEQLVPNVTFEDQNSKFFKQHK